MMIIMFTILLSVRLYARTSPAEPVPARFPPCVSREASLCQHLQISQTAVLKNTHCTS
jgi:hypothetical protein